MSAQNSEHSNRESRLWCGLPGNKLAKYGKAFALDTIVRLGAAALFLYGLAAGAFAAPDEARLGKDEGYPVCARAQASQTRCLIGAVSRFDEIFPVNRVPKGSQVRELKRAPREPAISYSTQFSSDNLDGYLSHNRTTGLLILKGDTILLERYQYERKPEQRMASYSMAKSVVSMLVGIALAEGKIKSIDDTAQMYLPELKGTPYGETQLKHLLTMSSGVRFTENYGGNDDVAVLGRISIGQDGEGGVATVMPFKSRERDPGEKFHYSSAETQVLGLVLRAATGKTLSAYLSEKIWQPMGAESDASWGIDKGGYESAFAFLNATVRDYARLGMLLANDGAMDGRQIIPADWVRAATTPSARQFQPGQADAYYGYGYQIWLLPGQRRQFVLRGLRGQMIFVDPASKLVMVHTAARETSGDPGYREVVPLWHGVAKALAD